MPGPYTPSRQVAEEAAALVDELWRAVGGSDPEAKVADHGHDGSGADDACSQAGPGRPETQGGVCLLCALKRRTDGFDLASAVDPAGLEGLADVVESAAVGLRAFASHLAGLRESGASGRPADGEGARPAGDGARIDDNVDSDGSDGSVRCSCEDADGRGGTSPG